MLLCGFHIHTRHSDGSADLGRTVDLFGHAGFDAIVITDHAVNGNNTLGRLTHRRKKHRDGLWKEVSAMVCKYFIENTRRCMNGLPVVSSFSSLICNRNPVKCPVFLWKTAA